MGLALADLGARIAQPYNTLQRINRNEDMRRLRELVLDENVKRIIIGLPLKLDGTTSDMGEEVTRFAGRVRKQIGVPVELVDERLTSWEAERVLEEEFGRRITHHETHHGRKKISNDSNGKYTVDAIAAVIILRDYLGQEHSAERHELL